MTKPKSSSKKSAAPKKARAKEARATSRRRTLAAAPKAGVAELQVQEIESLRREIEQRSARTRARPGRSARSRARPERSAELLPRWNANPEDVQKSVAQLVLALVEFLRKLLERQAIRRMEAETLDPEEIERIGLALMRLEEAVHELGARFGLAPEDLNLDLGPLGRLS